MSNNIGSYLAQFTEKAIKSGLDMAKPGKNWAPMRPLVRGSHISLSVSKDKIQVNLNNDDDAERYKFRNLYAERTALAAAIGTELIWEQKEGRKKTAVRATFEQGYENTDWGAQHDWAIKTMQSFVQEFGSRLSKIGQ